MHYVPCMQRSHLSAKMENIMLMSTRFNMFDSFSFQMDLKVFDAVLKHIDFHDPSFHVAVIAIIFNPLFWNVVSVSVLNCTCDTRCVRAPQMNPFLKE